jgi:hypothetical protein
MVPLLHVAAAVLHQAAPAATCDCHRCYIKPVPLLHVGLPLLHQATNMLHVAATAGTCDRRHCYTKLLMLLHADDAAATSGRQRATCGHRHCYIPVPPSLHQAAGVLHAATAVATQLPSLLQAVLQARRESSSSPSTAKRWPRGAGTAR